MVRATIEVKLGGYMLVFAIRDKRDNSYFQDIEQVSSVCGWADLDNNVRTFDKPQQALKYMRYNFDWNKNLVVSAIEWNGQTYEHVKDMYDCNGRLL